MNIASEDELDKRLQEISELTKGNRQELMRQLLLFRLGTPDRRAAMLAGMIIKRLGIEKTDVALGLLPVLEMNNSNAVETAENWLGEVHASRTSPVDFSTYAQLLNDRRQTVSPGFVRYLYRTSAVDALEMLAQSQMPEEEAAAVIAKGRRQNAGDLEQLAAKDLWWLDLFVIDQLERTSGKPSAGIVQRLQQSSDPHVREALRRIDGNP